MNDTGRRNDPAFEVGALLDSATVNAAHLRVMLLGMLAIVLDGFDIQVLAFAAPALIADWGIPKESLKWVFVAGVFGMAIGAFLVGPRGDSWGRRRALI